MSIPEEVLAQVYSLSGCSLVPAFLLCESQRKEYIVKIVKKLLYCFHPDKPLSYTFKYCSCCQDFIQVPDNIKLNAVREFPCFYLKRGFTVSINSQMLENKNAS